MTYLRTRFVRLHKTLSFTIVELLLIVILLGVITALAIPNFSNTYGNIQLKETAKNIAFLMRYAQNRAVTEKCIHRLVFDEEGTYYWIEKQHQDEESSDAFVRIPGRLGRKFSVGKEVAINCDGAPVLFYPDGRIAPARIYTSANGRFYTISSQEQIGYVHVFDFKIE